MSTQSSRHSNTTPAAEITSVGIIGAGQMGNGIAHVSAVAGYTVLINDLSKDKVDAAMSIIERNMTRQVSKGLLADADMKAALKRLSFAPAYGDFRSCDIVIEAATEDEGTKRKIFSELCKSLKPETLLASNTSSISITRLASVTDRP